MKHTVLFVDDEPNILKSLGRLFRFEGLDVLTAASPEEGLKLLQDHPAQVVVSDQRMPTMTGVDFLEQVRERHPSSVRMMLTGYTDMEIAVDAINRGQVYRLITKPWNDDELRMAVRQAIEQYDLKGEIKRLNHVTREQNFKLQDMNRTLESLVHERTKELYEKNNELRHAYIQTISALAESVDAKDKYTRGHSERVGVYASKIAREMQFPKEYIERVYIAGLLHDVGKIGIRDYALLKPQRLTPEEYAEIQRHPEIGAKILESISSLADIVPYVRHHHEWFDGSRRGYPDQLAGDQIPLPSRIILIADTIEAMTSDRPYRKALTLDRVEQELRDYAGTQFDPDCVQAFFSVIARDKEHFLHSASKFNIYEFIES